MRSTRSWVSTVSRHSIKNWGFNAISIASPSNELGFASEGMPCAFEGEAMEIAFNPQFFIEGVESVETEEVVLRLTSPLRPGLLQPAGSEDFSYLVMPIRLTV